MLNRLSLMLFGPPTDRDVEWAKREMLSVSPQKPLGYLEWGMYEGEKIRPRCLAYIPPDFLAELITNKDIFIITNKEEVNNGQTIRAKSVPESKNIIYTTPLDKNFSKTFVVHLEALKELLELNQDIALDILNKNREMISAEEFKTIDQNATIAFVKLVGIKDFSSNPLHKVLIDVAFADKSCIQASQLKSIKLPERMSNTYRR